jgi:hypothetical protein
MIRHPALRWDDAVISLISKYVLYYLFKLNMLNLIDGIRKFVDTPRANDEKHKSDDRLFRK